MRARHAAPSARKVPPHRLAACRQLRCPDPAIGLPVRHEPLRSTATASLAVLASSCTALRRACLATASSGDSAARPSWLGQKILVLPNSLRTCSGV